MTPFKAIRTLHADMHPSARCLAEGCGWTSPESSQTLADVKWHCQHTGHAVDVTRVTYSTYLGVERS
jgi:hypothetical protein